MMTSDFRPEVEMSQVRACALKTTLYNRYLMPHRRPKFRALQAIGVEEHDGEYNDREFLGLLEQV